MKLEEANYQEENVLAKLAEEEDIEVFVAENAAGQNVIGVISEGYQYLLGSKYDQTPLIETWCNQETWESPYAVTLLFGMANGDYIRALRERNKEMLIIVYEPSYSIAYINRESLGVEEFLEDEKLIINIGEAGMAEFYHAINSVVDYTVAKHTKIMISPNYENVFKNEWEKVRDIYRDCMLKVFAKRNTVLAFGEKMTANIADNVIDYVTQYSLKDLEYQFECVDKATVPAIIVSAGPSLDKNIHELKRAKGKAFIIAVDTALNPLAKAGIIPDISVTVDPHKHLNLFEHPDMIEVPMVFCVTSNAKIKNIHKGIRIYQNTLKSPVDKYIKQFEKESEFLETGGSVANDAFSLTQRLGFQTVIFIGQDLAYPNDQEHSKDSYGDKKSNDVKDTDKEFFEVEDIYGGKVKTEYNMNMYRVWFERAVDVYTDMKFIDATEGGAKIHGMEIMTLRDAIDRECTSKVNVDFSKIIHATGKMFTEEEQEEIFNDLANYEEHLNCMRQKLEDGIRVYDRLNMLTLRKDYNSKEFKRCINSVTELNNWVNDDDDMEYLSLYVAKDEFQMRENIYDKVESIEEEMELIVTNGKKMLQALLGALEEVRADMEPVIAQAKEKVN